MQFGGGIYKTHLSDLTRFKREQRIMLLQSNLSMSASLVSPTKPIPHLPSPSARPYIKVFKWESRASSFIPPHPYFPVNHHDLLILFLSIYFLNISCICPPLHLYRQDPKVTLNSWLDGLPSVFLPPDFPSPIHSLQ